MSRDRKLDFYRVSFKIFNQNPARTIGNNFFKFALVTYVSFSRYSLNLVVIDFLVNLSGYSSIRSKTVLPSLFFKVTSNVLELSKIELIVHSQFRGVVLMM